MRIGVLTAGRAGVQARAALVGAGAQHLLLSVAGEMGYQQLVIEPGTQAAPTAINMVEIRSALVTLTASGWVTGRP